MNVESDVTTPDSLGRSPTETRVWTLGLSMLVLAAVFLFWSGSDRNISRAPGDPGPWLVPRALAIVLALGGIWELLKTATARQRFRNAASDAAEDIDDRSRMDAVGLRTWLMMAGCGVYAASIPWLGFSLATGLFTCVSLIALGSRWWVSVLMAGATVLFIQLLFTRLFVVPLPEGLFQ